jgi:DNA polymerase-1
MTERIVFLFDMVGEDEIRNGQLKGDSRTVNLYRYLVDVVKATHPDATTQLLIASPGPGKATAKELKEHADLVKKSILEFGPTVICACGKSTIYSISDWLPDNFPRTLKYQRLWGKYFTAKYPSPAPAKLRGAKSKSGTANPDDAGVQQGRTRIVFTPSPSMVWASKGQEGGYLHLRTISENITGALLQITDTISTVSHLVSERSQLHALKDDWTSGSKLGRLSSNAVIAVDTETTGLNVVTDKVRTVQFSVKDGESYVVPFELLNPAEWTDTFEELRRAGYVLVLQNGKYDSKILAGNGVDLGAYSELSVAHVLVDEREGTHNLDFIGQQILGAGKSEITTEQLVNGPIDEKFVHYAGRDTDITRRAYQILSPEVRNKPSFRTLNRSAELLAKGESYGIKLNQDRLQVLVERTDAKLAEYQAMFDDLGLNPKSPAQVKKMLDMDGKSDKKALAELGTDLADAVIDYRGLIKVKSSYLDRLQASAAIDGRFHPDIRLAGPVTGRTSSGSGTVSADQLWLPINSQNIPRPDKGQKFKYLSEELRADLRYCFIADEGRVMLGMDLAAAEMRMAANICLDPVMIDDLNRKVDTHSLLTAIAYGLDKKHGFEIDYENPQNWIPFIRPQYEFERDGTKAATFATLYGGGLPAIAAQAKCDEDTARLLRSTIYGRYTGLEKWINKIHQQVRTTGTVTTRYGRRRIFPYSTGVFNNQDKQSMLREAQNYVIQSEANDYCLMGINKFLDNLPGKFAPVYYQNFVHDAGYFSVSEDDADEAKVLLVEMMETADKLPAIMYADAKYAQSWGDL